MVRRDNKRVRDLKAVNNRINTYYTDFGHYPIISNDVSDKDDQWRLLYDILDSASMHYRKNYTHGFPEQNNIDNLKN